MACLYTPSLELWNVAVSPADLDIRISIIAHSEAFQPNVFCLQRRPMIGNEKIGKYAQSFLKETRDSATRESKLDRKTVQLLFSYLYQL